MYVKCKVLKERMGRRGNKISWTQTGMGFKKYFHMSGAVKWSRLTGYPHFGNAKHCSHYAKYTFLRASMYPKMKREWSKPTDWSKLWEEYNNV